MGLTTAIERFIKKQNEKRLLGSEMIELVEFYKWLRFCIVELREKTLIDEYYEFICWISGELSLLGIPVETLDSKININNYTQEYFSLKRKINLDSLKNMDSTKEYNTTKSFR